MADLQMVNSKDAEKLGLSSTLVTHEEWEAAKGEQGNGGVPLEPATPPESAETEDLPDECEDPVTAAAAAEAAAADAVLFEDGPQEAQEAAPEEPDVSVEAGVAKKPRKGRKPATGDDAGQSVVADPATLDGTEALEATEA